ncbi:MAG: S-layer homology domain-containing protein, partial [Clostridia bacterium]|nr:S-layer homology domain-containing protein [Clostridia bacterium]
NYALKFNDIKDGDWYEEAVRWAASEGIISGISDGLFGTDEPLTREQLAVILYRYMQKKNLDISADKNISISSYDDYKHISDYALTAVSWAVKSGVIQGETPSTVNPQNSATRAQIAMILMRFCENQAKQN